MAAAYDNYNYPSYWEGREYEHGAEILAIQDLMANIPKIKRVLEIGAGYGRLTPTYLHRATKVILTDPSARLLKLARSSIKSSKVVFLQVKIQKLRKRIKGKSIDLVIVVRVLHHVESLDNTFSIVNRLLRKNGYFLLEFPNKRHVKATISEFFKGNFTFPLDIFPKDVRSDLVKDSSLPFFNYHPDVVKQKLIDAGFTIVAVRSVSNVRSPMLKRHIPLELLLGIEKRLQKLLAPFSVGPSIFILAKKIN